jgi:signal peptidase
MGIRSIFRKIGNGLTILLVASVLLSSVLGQPFLFGHVVTGSMKPTIEPGDGFIALPPAVEGELSKGDTVTFRAKTIGGGGLTTHRIVRETDQGFITRGDGNTVTDQQDDEPPVQRSQIVAVVLQIGGDPVIIPHLGTVITTVSSVMSSVLGLFEAVGVGSSSIGSIMSIFGVGLIGASLLMDLLSSDGRSEDRSVSRDGQLFSGWVLLILIVVISLPLTVAMMLPSGTQTTGIVSTESPVENDPSLIQAGTSANTTYTVTSNYYLPELVILEPGGPGVSFEDRLIHVSGSESVNTTVKLSAPPETGSYVRARSEFHYIQILPTPVLVTLHEIHPYVAIFTICFVVSFPVIILFILTVGFRPIAIRSVHD